MQNIEYGQSTDSLAKCIADFIDALSSQNVSVDHYICQPLHTVRASEEEIAHTEAKLDCAIPPELRTYYLTQGNGTEEMIVEMSCLHRVNININSNLAHTFLLF